MNAKKHSDANFNFTNSKALHSSNLEQCVKKPACHPKKCVSECFPECIASRWGYLKWGSVNMVYNEQYICYRKISFSFFCLTQLVYFISKLQTFRVLVDIK